MTDPRKCPFREPPGDRIAFEEPLAFGLWDAFPANPGHLLLVTRRHVPTWFEATQEEQAALVNAIDTARAVIQERHRPDGFNIGLNVGKAAGETVPHLPALFGLPFSIAVWNAGFVVRPGHIFLLVTLDKSGKGSDFQYRDHFLSPTLFQWESQNRTRREDAHGQLIRSHKEQGIPVHLFIRKTAKQAGKGAAPFMYCGNVDFVDWEGEKPITVRWKVPEPVPKRLHEEFQAGDERP